MKQKPRVLIIGGAGFIGSHTADELHKHGYIVRILDNLNPKTHSGKWPKYLKSIYEKHLGDERNPEQLLEALKGCDYVIDLAAEMDLLPIFSHFIDNNVTSTALLYELIVKHNLPIKKVVVASTQFVYGEGRWECYKHGIVFPKPRVDSLLSKQIWDPTCPYCGGKIKNLFNLEVHQDPPNQYAISKYTQELLALKLGRLYNIPSSAVRYSIVHGPRQSIKHAYSGVKRVFALQLLANKSLSVYEDGLQLRDYVSVYDVASANRIVMESRAADFENFNVGSGYGMTVLDFAKLISKVMKKRPTINITGQYRAGDIRHAVSDISKLESLGWKQTWDEEKTISSYVKWLKNENIDFEALSSAKKSMEKMGVLRGATPAKNHKA